MKKVLSWLLALALSVTCLTAVVGCDKTKDGENPDNTTTNNNNNTVDNQAIVDALIETLNGQYKNAAKETAANYTVVASVSHEEKSYPVSWSVSAVTSGVTIGDYVEVGAADTANNTVPVQIKKADRAVDYKLNASVTVNEKSGSVSFDRTIPQAIDYNALLNSAKAELEADIIPTRYVGDKTVTLPTKAANDVPYTWEVTQAPSTASVSVDNGSLVVSNVSATEETAKLTATVTASADVKATVEYTLTLCTKIFSDENDGSSAEKAISVADVLKVYETLQSGEVYKEGGSEKQLYIKGVVTDPGDINNSYGTVYGLKNTYIADEAAGTPTALVYNINWNDVIPQPSNGTNPVKAGDTLIVTGFIKIYDTTREIAQGSNKVYPSAAKWTLGSAWTDEQKCDLALDYVEVETNITKDFTLPSPIAAAEGVTFAWSSNDTSTISIDGYKATVNATQDKEVKLTVRATTTSFTTGKTKDITVNVKAGVEIPAEGKEFTLNFATSNFRSETEGYAKDWSNSYSNRSVNLADIGLAVDGQVSFSSVARANADTKVPDRPALAAKNSLTDGATIEIHVADAGVQISAVEFDLYEWTASKAKKFSKIVIQTSSDGTSWTDVDGTVVGDGKSNTLTMTEENLTRTASGLAVNYVRLCVHATGKDNQQFGLTSIKLTLKSVN